MHGGYRNDEFTLFFESCTIVFFWSMDITACGGDSFKFVEKIENFWICIFLQVPRLAIGTQHHVQTGTDIFVKLAQTKL